MGYKLNMKTYSDEFKKSVIARMLSPHNVGVSELSRETGIPRDTLYTWRAKHCGKVNGSNPEKNSKLRSEDKFAFVLETALMNAHDLSAFCRQKGLYPEQIQAWEALCKQANAPGTSKEDREKIRRQSKQIQALETELRRKDRALAETAALLVLKKKAQEIWGEEEGK